MGIEIQYPVSSIFRFILISGVGHFGTIFIAAQILKRKHSIWWMILYDLFKIIVVNTILGMVMRNFNREVYLRTEWMPVLYTVSILTVSIFTFVMYCFTFEGEVIKVVVVALAANLVVSFLAYFSIGLTNLLEGRSFFQYYGEFQPLDLEIPVICFGVLALVCYFCRPFLRKIGEHKYKHKKLLMMFFISYVAIGDIQMLMTEPLRAAQIAIVLTLMTAGVIIIIAFYMISKYRKTIRSEQSFLMMQKELMGAHYQKVQEQISQIENSREAVSEKMSSVVRHCNGVYGSGNDSVFANGREQASIYMQSLVAEYKGLKAGMYCDDWMLDAVLSSQAEWMENQGIEFECSAREYQGGRVGQQELISFILYLIHLGIRANKELVTGESRKISLHISEVKKQLLIEFRSSWNEREMISRRKIEKQIQKYGGRSTIDVQKDKNCVRITVIMQEG